MAGERNFLRVPPDGAGKRVRMKHTAQIFYSGLSPTSHEWVIDGTYYTEFGGTKYSIHVHGATKITNSTGILEVHYNSVAVRDNLTPDVGGDIFDEDNATILAQVTEARDVYINSNHILGYDNPEFGVNVDETGSMNIRFSEGLPQLDAFGRLRVSTATTLGEYNFTTNTLPGTFATKIVGNATATFDDNIHCLKLTCPSGVPATGSIDAGLGYDQVAHTTNTYHHYFPGFSQTAIMTVALGDTGRNGVTRNWGYFDAQNGYGFRCNDATSGLKVFIRTDTSGAVTETVIAQADFNKDVLDGTGDSKMDLRLNDDNIYWIDVQWLGAGRVRFGTYHRGQRVVMHEHYHEGSLNEGKPSASRGSLPLCFVQKNTANNLSDATMAVWCGSVLTENQVDISKLGRNRLQDFEKTFDPTAIENAQEYELLGVLTPVRELTNSNHVNRSIYLPNYLDTTGYHTDGVDARYGLEIYVNPVLGGGNKSFPILQSEITDSATAWFTSVDALDPNNAAFKYDPTLYDSATRPKFWGGGTHILAYHVKGEKYIDLSDIYANLQDGAFKNFAENGGTSTQSIASIVPSPNPSTPTAFTVTTPVHLLREGNPIKFKSITGTVGTNAVSGLNYDSARDNTYYIRITGANTGQLYEDIEFNTPAITQGLSYTSGGTARGDFGSQIYFAAVAEPLAPTIAKKVADSAQDVTVHFTLGWSEILQ